MSDMNTIAERAEELSAMALEQIKTKGTLDDNTMGGILDNAKAALLALSEEIKVLRTRAEKAEAALRELVATCRLADYQGDLPDQIDGDLIWAGSEWVMPKGGEE